MKSIISYNSFANAMGCTCVSITNMMNRDCINVVYSTSNKLTSLLEKLTNNI